MALPANRRRSQRLFLQVPVVVEGQRANKTQFSENTQTVIVNAHGALVESGASLEPGQSVILRHARTNEQIECTVKLVTAAESGMFHLALEFNSPNPAFWHISFPPEDWSVRNPGGTKKA